MAAQAAVRTIAKSWQLQTNVSRTEGPQALQTSMDLQQKRAIMADPQGGPMQTGLGISRSPCHWLCSVQACQRLQLFWQAGMPS